MDIKLVVSDVDGTLLNSRHELSNFTRTTLLALQKQEIKFTVATGKILPAVIDVVKALDLTQPLILANGAIIQRPDGLLLYEMPLAPEYFSALLELVKASGLDYALYTRDRIFVPCCTSNTSLVVEYNDPEPVEIGQMDLADKTFCKLTVLERNDLDKLNHLRDFLNEKFDGLIKVHLSVPGMLEVFSAQTSKSLAVQIVAAKLKIDLQQVMVFGDSFNDLDMFKTAGRAVAMGNAADFIKRAAHITIRTNDQDGLAHYISTFFSL